MENARYYKSEPSKMGFLEAVRVVRGNFYIVWGSKLLGLRLPSPPATMTYPDSPAWGVIPETAVPPEARGYLDPILREAAQTGFGPPIYQEVPGAAKNNTFGARCLHRSGEILLVVLFTRVGAKVSKIHCLMSFMADGSYLLTTSSRKMMDSIDEIVARRLTRAPWTKLLEEHEKLLDEHRMRGSVLSFRDQASAEHAYWDYQRKCFDFNIRRGVYRPATEHELKAVEIATGVSLSPGEGGIKAPPHPHAQVLSEMWLLTHKKSDWKAALPVLLISAALFMAFGLKGNTVRSLLIICGILFFHEAGHYVAMRLFKYQNLKMFFIPMFGAAVTGVNYDVPGWKKALVSMAGPLPGIVAGVGFLIYSARVGDPLAKEIGMMAVAINGFNLVPFMPLDGGQYMNAILFSRHPWIETAAKGIAGVALIVAGLKLGGGLMVAGAFTLLGIGMSLKIAQVAHDLKKQGVSTAAADPNDLPLETRSLIIQSLLAKFNGKPAPRQLAEHALAVCEKMNARPPRFLGTSLLLGLYFFALIGGFLGLGGATLAGRSRKSEETMRIMMSPPYLFTHTNTQPPAVVSQPHGLIVVTSHAGDDGKWIQSAIQDAKLNPLANDRIASSHFISFPTNEWKKAKRAVQAEASSHEEAQVSFFTPGKSRPSTSWTFRAPSEEAAVRIHADLQNSHLPLSGIKLMEPWRSGFVLSDEIRAARRQWHALSEAESAAEGAYFDELEEEETKPGSKSKPRPEPTSPPASLLASNLVLHLTNHPGTIDPEVLKAYQASMPTTNRGAFLSHNHADLLKSLGIASQETDDASPHGTSADRNKTLITVRFLSFNDTASGMHSFGAWLAREGCTNIHYAVGEWLLDGMLGL